MKRVDFKDELKNLLSSLKQTPFIKRVFIYDNEKSFDSCYGWLETINNDVIYIQRSLYIYLGWELSYEYNIGKNGTGCQCTEEPKTTISEEDVKNAALYGKCFCYKHGAIPYKDFEDFKSKSWCEKYIKEL
jgi:hypothetical protein